MSQTFSHAGVSKLNGEFKVRFANDALRVKVLAKNGHKDIDIVELKHPMTKEDAVAYLMQIDFANGNKAVQAAIEEAAGKRGVKDQPSMAKIEKKVAAKKAEAKATTKTGAAKVKPSKTVEQAAKEVVANLEDAPF
jgi:hypothetical protein